MSMLGPYASWNKETGYAVWDHPRAEYTGIFERLNVHIKGIIHVGMWDFVEYGCYTKLVGDNVIGIEANPQVYKDMAKPVADKWGFKCFNEFLSDKDKEVRDFYFAGEGSSLFKGQPQWNKNVSIKVQTKTLSTVIEENEIDMNGQDWSCTIAIHYQYEREALPYRDIQGQLQGEIKKEDEKNNI